MVVQITVRCPYHESDYGVDLAGALARQIDDTFPLNLTEAERFQVKFRHLILVRVSRRLVKSLFGGAYSLRLVVEQHHRDAVYYRVGMTFRARELIAHGFEVIVVARAD